MAAVAELRPSLEQPSGNGVVIRPDVGFIKDVIASGGQDLKKCFQCATCSTVCTLSPDDEPFPRKQMIEAQWGLKDRLMADPAIWLCHNCGDCSTHCPRGARPGDVLGAIRREAVKHFAFPSFLGSAVASPKALLVLFLLPVLVFAAIALWAPKGAPTAELEFADVFPIPVMEALFFTVSGFVILAFGIGISRFISALRASGAGGDILAGLVPALLVVLTHRRFSQCGKEKSRYVGHMLTFWGFIGLAATGTAVGIGTMAGVMSTPLDLISPWKLLANLSAVVILIGSVILLADRIKDPVKRARSTYFDWFFLVTIAGVVVTGLASELLRLAQAASVMYSVYFVHLVLIFALFLYAPYSKFAHLAYRTVAMAARGERPRQ
jgi:quinone-modifying oxidoreductase subunit QmoC